MGRKSIAWWHDENIGNHELIPVKITSKVANYRVGTKVYLPGDIVEVPEFAICPDFMERVNPVVEPEPEVVEPEPEPEPEPVVEEAEEEPEPEPTEEDSTVDEESD